MEASDKKSSSVYQSPPNIVDCVAEQLVRQSLLGYDTQLVFTMEKIFKIILKEYEKYQNALNCIDSAHKREVIRNSMEILELALMAIPIELPRYLKLASVVIRLIHALYAEMTLLELFALVRDEFLQPGDSFFEKQLFSTSRFVALPSDDFAVKVMRHFLVITLYGLVLYYVRMLLDDDILHNIGITVDEVLRDSITKCHEYYVQIFPILSNIYRDIDKNNKNLAYLKQQLLINPPL